MQCIAKQDLQHGFYYVGQCRNASIARWCAMRNQFVHWRTKFGHRYLEWIHHPDDEQRYDVFYPEMLCTNPVDEIPID